MSFEETREALAAAARERERVRHDVVRARDELARLERAVLDAQRRGEDVEQPSSARVREAQEVLAAVLAHERRLVGEFLPFSDPRETVARLDDTTPILLFPLRIETRFKQVARDGVTRDELWVRVFPDECLVDGFQAALSEAEAEAALRYWTAWYAAGGVEAQQRAAWRGLVTRLGSGRAAYAVQQWLPDPATPAPAKDDPGDVLLVVVTDAPLAGGEHAALLAFWTAVYRTPDDAAARAAAVETLRGAVGDARADQLVERYVPANLAEEPVPPGTRADVPVGLAYLTPPAEGSVTVTTHAWNEPARVDLLPDRLVLLAYDGAVAVVDELGEPIPRPLVVSPDPSADEADAMHEEDDHLVVGTDLEWMVDFDAAVAAGMGFVVPLTAAQAARGFDRLFVLGVRTSLDADAAAGEVERLVEHHRYSRKGFGLVPQGTPTNNTEDGDSAFGRFDDPDASYDDLFGDRAAFAPTGDVLAKPDGQWLAELLGLDPALFRQVHHAYGLDQADARAANRALWPATWGYFLESMMLPALGGDTITATRDFFNDHVLGRGAVPAIRVGRQPYGILPTTAFSRIEWFSRSGRDPVTTAAPPPAGPSFLQRLHTLLSVIETHWAPLTGDVSFVGKTGSDRTPQQLLLDVVGLNPVSVEFHQRYAESIEHLVNQLKLDGLGGLFVILALGAHVQNGVDLLASLGYAGDPPEILGKLFLGQQNKLVGDLVDDQPVSETAGIRPYTPDQRNYVRWLRDAAATSHDTLRAQQGFTDGKRPTALLYLMLHHALDLTYYDVGLNLHVAAGVLSAEAAYTLRKEQPFVHVATSTQVSESKWQLLYEARPEITGSDTVLLGEFIPTVAAESDGARYLAEQLRALDHLATATTARLERALVEHLDTCAYRLDAWRLGLVNHELFRLRYGGSREGVARRGVFAGAYGWLEDVHSENKVLQPAAVPDDLAAVFQPAGTPPLEVDPANAGYVHAPSLDHAVTAAILRNGYRANATPAQPDLLAVNLSSRRVREALAVVEGIRAGQSMAALLGYRFERHLHDAAPAVEVDEFVFELRKAFPLVADRIPGTVSGDGDPIDQVEARNVVDGLELVEHVARTGQATYPYGKTLPGSASPAQRAVMDEAVRELMDVRDAVADLAVAESVHQVVRGNLTRAAATLDTYSKGSFPPTPEVVQTPRTGTTLTHRVGVHLDAGADPAAAVNGVAPTPRSRAEPAVNLWLAGLLPLPAETGCRVRFTDVDGAARTVDVSQAALGLQPADLLYLLDPAHEPLLSALDDLVVAHVNGLPKPPHAASLVEVSYREFAAGQVSFFELSPLLASLRELLLRSRPLRAADVRIAHEADANAVEDVAVDPARLSAASAALEAARDELRDVLVPGLAARLADPVANEQGMVDDVDQLVGDWAAVSVAVARAAATPSTLVDAYTARAIAYRAVVAKVEAFVARWQLRLDEYDALLTDAAAAPTEEAGVAILEQAERKVSTETTTPRPANRAAYLLALAPKRLAFDEKRQALADAVDGSADTLAALFAAVEAELPVTGLDPGGFDLAGERASVVVVVRDLHRQAVALEAALTRRLAASAAAVADGGAAATPDEAVRAYTDAARALLGEDFAILPRFRLAAAHAAEWTNAYAARASLLDALADRELPVDDWLHGVARVRDKVWHWENATMLAEVLRDASPSLEPVQLPHRSPDYWLALEFPDLVLGTTDPFVVAEDKLLYTAHYATAFDAADPQCGVLVDEWTETLPVRDEDTGLTFHYDRPSGEPPQALLLAVAPRHEGGWRWDDLVEALHDTLDLAKGRAREPRQVDETAYAQLLPATVSAVTVHPLTIALNYAVANGVLEVTT